MKRAAVYLRGLNPRSDHLPTRNASYARSHPGPACEIVKVYKDHGISGAKGRDKRPAFDDTLSRCHQAPVRHGRGMVG
jgi:hypothetical protein